MENTLEIKIDKRKEIYGSFLLSGSEFAISVDVIQEVVNEPQAYSPVPLAPDYLLGLFNLRGMIIPVVDLRTIFGFEVDENVSQRKVAIIEHGNLCVGILFDYASEVFNEKDVEKNDFLKEGENQKEKVIEGVFKLENGNRMIQILNPHELLNLKDLPKTDESVAQKINLKKRGKREQCISFKVGNSVCALGINCIQEIVKVEKIDNTALSNEICLGAINIRGNTIPVINFEKILGYDSEFDFESATIKDYRIIILKLDNELFGLLVQSVESIISYFKDEIIQFPVLSSAKKAMFKGCLELEGEAQTILLDHSEVLSNAEIDRITRGHSKLYREHSESVLEEKKRNITKKTYITFCIGDSYALEIDDVREVIDFPEDVLHPPNLSTHFMGMMNLRGDLIPIIDPRELYQLQEEKSVKGDKVLIFESEGGLYGLVVDSVDSIVSVNEDDKVQLPEILYKGSSAMSHDVKQAIQILSGEQKDETFLILDIMSLSARISKEQVA